MPLRSIPIDSYDSDGIRLADRIGAWRNVSMRSFLGVPVAR